MRAGILIITMRSIRIVSVVALMLIMGFAITSAVEGCGVCGDGSRFDLDAWNEELDSIWGNSGGGSGPADSGSGGGDPGGADSSGSGSNGGSGGGGGTGPSSSESAGSTYVSGGSVEDGLLSRMKGDELFSKGLYDEALVEYQKSTVYDPYSSRAWKGKGMTLQALGRPDEAVVAFQRALKLDPSDVATQVLLGDAYLDAGEYEEAVGQYTKALGMNPNLQGVTQKLSAASTLALGIVELPEETPEPAPEETTPAPVTTQTLPPADTADLPPQQTAGFPGVMVIMVAFLIGSLILFTRIR
jgi:tetratricopeptide (TPR) repeat protein